ncbi:MAG: hypothetical protein ACRCUE_04510 [Bosea sp. (in: a-proteobacteria)]
MRVLLLSLFAAIFASIFAAPGFAQTPHYLNSEAMFAKGWSELVDKMGPTVDVTDIIIRPDAIEVQARAEAGGARIDRWRVGYLTVMSMTFHRVSGPTPERPSTPVKNIESGFFRLPAVPIDRLWSILEGAKIRVKLDDPGRITAVRIARQMTILPEPAFGDVRWTISVGNDRESASVTAAADGRVMGADISGTNRGRNKNFHEQDEWPLADAQASFRSVVNARNEVYEIDVSRTTIAMKAVAANNPKSTTAWMWDGGTFRRDFVDMPNFDLIRNNGNLSFSLDDLDIAKIPTILKEARDKAPTGHTRVMIAKAIKERVAVGTPRVLWEVQLTDARRQVPLLGEDFSERAIVHLTPDGTVVTVRLPRSLRPKVDQLSPDTVLASIEKLRSSLGQGAKLFEVSFNEDQAKLTMISPDQPRMTFEVALREKLEETSPRSVSMVNLRSTFSFGDLAKLDKATLESMLSRAKAAIPLPGAKVHRIRIWSGEPFWRPRPGMPYLDIRVGIPPRFDDGGYVVFSADGKLIETVK